MRSVTVNQDLITAPESLIFWSLYLLQNSGLANSDPLAEIPGDSVIPGRDGNERPVTSSLQPSQTIVFAEGFRDPEQLIIRRRMAAMP
jgi:hypothetical protein